MGYKIVGTDDDDHIGTLNYDDDDAWPEGIGEDNEIYGYGGDDLLCGQWGSDVIFGGTGNDVLYGGADMDVLYGEDDNDYLYGDWGDDWLLGGSGDDTLYGGEDNDLLFGGSGSDVLDGEDGNDTAHYGDSDSGVIVILADGTGEGGTAEGDMLANIENLVGSLYNDALFGDQFANNLDGSDGNDFLGGGAGADTLSGGYGNDTLAGGDDDDWLWGGSGDDLLMGGAGADTLVGGDGIDTATYVGSAQGVVVSLMNNSIQSGDAKGDTFDGIENVTGSTHADELIGDDGVNTLIGSDGDDTLFGLNDNDELDGGDGSDILDGGKGMDKMLGGADDDTYIVDSSMDSAFEAVGEGALDRVQTSVSYQLEAGSEIEVLETTDKAGSTALVLTGNEFGNNIIGNDGANALIGGMGLDFMTGNGGGDAFWWNSTAETADNPAGADVVMDFVAGLDKLWVNAIDANETNGAIDDGFEFIGTNPFTAPGQINYIVGRSDTYIQLNTDGDLDPEAVICVVGQHTVDSGWFAL